MTTIVEDVPAVVEIENLIDVKLENMTTEQLRELSTMLFRKADDVELKWMHNVDARRRSDHHSRSTGSSRRGN